MGQHDGSIIIHVVYTATTYAGDKIEKNEMGWACGAYGMTRGGVQGLGVETGGKETTGETQAQMGG